jgi:DNA-directed RNA polymerase specialized sigma24 family protein
MIQSCLDYPSKLRETAAPKGHRPWVNHVRSISSLIEAAEQGDRSAAEALFGALYSELRRVARRELARHGGPVSLSATTLLHEAYLDIAARNGNGPSFPDRARFMSYAARVMRGLIIDFLCTVRSETLRRVAISAKEKPQKNFRSTISASEPLVRIEPLLDPLKMEHQ